MILFNYNSAYAKSYDLTARKELFDSKDVQAGVRAYVNNDNSIVLKQNKSGLQGDLAITADAGINVLSVNKDTKGGKIQAEVNGPKAYLNVNGVVTDGKGGSSLKLHGNAFFNLYDVKGTYETPEVCFAKSCGKFVGEVEAGYGIGVNCNIDYTRDKNGKISQGTADKIAINTGHKLSGNIKFVSRQTENLVHSLREVNDYLQNPDHYHKAITAVADSIARIGGEYHPVSQEQQQCNKTQMLCEMQQLQQELLAAIAKAEQLSNVSPNPRNTP